MPVSPADAQGRTGPGRPLKPLGDPSSALGRLGALIRQLRLERRLTLIRLGELTGYSCQHLGAIERGQVVPAEAVIVACERTLGAGGQLAAAFPAVIREQASNRHRREAARRDTETLSDLGPGWSKLATAMQRPLAVSAGLTDKLEQITSQHRVLYHELSSAQLLGTAEAHLGLLTGLLRGTQPDGRVRHRIAAAAAETAGLTAWLWFDLGDRSRMGALYSVAASLIEEAGDPALGAYVTGYRALTADACGSAREAVLHAQTAWDQAPAITSRLTRSWLAAVGASILARAGDRRAAMNQLRQARTHLDAAHGAEEWMYDFDHSALAGYRGQCHLRLGEAAAAVTAFREGLAALPDGCHSRGALLMIGLAEACLGRNEVDAARQHALEALAAFTMLGSEAGVLRVRRFREQLTAAGHPRDAAELDERIHDYLPGKP